MGIYILHVYSHSQEVKDVWRNGWCSWTETSHPTSQYSLYLVKNQPFPNGWWCLPWKIKINPWIVILEFMNPPPKKVPRKPRKNNKSKYLYYSNCNNFEVNGYVYEGDLMADTHTSTYIDRRRQSLEQMNWSKEQNVFYLFLERPFWHYRQHCKAFAEVRPKTSLLRLFYYDNPNKP